MFNITKMLEWILDNTDEVVVEEVATDEFPWGSSTLNQSHLDSVDLDQPIIVAEIAPGRYNVIDGNHRMEKARRMGVASLPAYRLGPEQHTRFLTNRKSYEAYVDYWNEKLKDLEEYGPTTA